MPAFRPNSVILYVADVDASTEFYRAVLGAEPLEKFEGFSVFALSDTVTLGLQAADQIDPAAEPHVGGSELSLSDVDRETVDRLYEAWRALGVPMALEPTELAFGYTFVATDPDGHRLRVCATDTAGLPGAAADLDASGSMRLLLLSYGAGAVPAFLASCTDAADSIRIGYINDAARPYDGADFVIAERERLEALGHSLVDITVSDFERASDFAAVLDGLDAVYVAGGNTFVLLAALRRHGADQILVDRVRSGLPYIGASAGTIITGPSIEPVSLMDDPADAPDLADYTGLGLIEDVVIPHADGALPPYPPELIERIKQTYQTEHQLRFLNDDQAILVEGTAQKLLSSP